MRVILAILVMSRTLLMAVGVCWALQLSQSATGQTAGLTINQVAERMVLMDQTRAAQLKSYTVTRRYVLDNKRFHKHAEMLVRMTYTSPGDKQFEVLAENGSGTIRKRVFRGMIEAEMEASRAGTRKQTQIIPENYEFRLLGTETQGGRPCYLVEVTPRIRNKFLLRGRIWVDAGDFAIVRIEGSPAVNPSLWARKIKFVHRYEKFGPFWLAVSNHSETEVVFFGRTEVTLEYFDYQILPSSPPRAETGDSPFGGKAAPGA